LHRSSDVRTNDGTRSRRSGNRQKPAEVDPTRDGQCTIGVILKRHKVEFATKAVAVIEPLLEPPTDGPLFCVDEKPGIGVREPTARDQLPTSVGQRDGNSSMCAMARSTCWPAFRSRMTR
jgi:hypothetical protein